MKMNQVVLYCLFSIVIWSLVILRIRKKNRDNLHLNIIFLLVYILNYPVKMIATKYGIHLIDSNAIGEDKQLQAMIFSDISVMLMIGVFALKPKLKHHLDSRLWSGTYDFWNASIFFVILFAISGWISYGSGSISRMFSLSAMMDYRAYRWTNSLGGGIRGLFAVIMTISLCAFIYLGMCATWKKSFGKKCVFLLMVILLTYYGYAQTLAKTDLLMSPIALIVSYQMCSKRDDGKGIPFQLIGVVSVAGLFSVAVMELVDVMAVHEVRESRWIALLNSFFNPSFDAPDNLTAIIDRMDNIWLGQLMYVPFFYNLFLSRIPRAIWAGKSPLDGKVMIVKNLLPEFFVSNREYTSASPSIVGDALASGGLFFAVILSVLYGVIFYNIYRNARDSDNLISNLMYLFLIINLNNFCRGGSDLLGNLLYYYVLICAICVIYKAFNKIRFKTGAKYLWRLYDKQEERYERASGRVDR